ncbi:hypothetical protein LTR96_011683 [Exophiala xenobiotica]|nr:hypothetical protein LTR72_012149 [Exophiala xenobiotica]KAK5262844.1 hypothetical protein LTR96_011683 [Exophiala xenobiotica]KAK5282293.1 hypothetical protein LTR14_012047 [Exophiala xenobiotica]KAK5332177.1 hypothetical protein LTR98_011682 [Exophiala xenobiotica]KAK5454890.1 hypothetical protein LTR55_012111 [Exophiala xenobiotica]
MPGDQWSPEEEMLYLSLMKEGRRQGRHGERFKAEFWKECLERMKLSFPRTSIKRLNSKRAKWKETWSVFLKLYHKSGFAYDEETGWFDAEDEVWETMKEGPLAKCYYFKSHPMLYKKELEEIFGKSTATGAFARSRHQLVADFDSQTVNSETMENSQSPFPPMNDSLADESDAEGDSYSQLSEYSQAQKRSLESTPVSQSSEPSAKRSKKTGGASVQELIDLVKQILEKEKSQTQTQEKDSTTARQRAIQHLLTNVALEEDQMVVAVNVVNAHFELFTELGKQPDLQLRWPKREIEKEEM